MATSRGFSGSISAASDELSDIYCEPCSGEGKQVEAEGFCVDCQEYLCGQCFNSHGRFKAFKHHVLLDKDIMPTEVGRTGVLDVCVEQCRRHPTKVIEYFCRSCDTLGCSACITTNHRQCETVDHIPDIVTNLENNEDFIEFAEKLDKNLRSVEERKKKICSEKSDADEMKKKASVVLKKQRDEINKFFDNLEAEMNGRIARIYQRNKDTLNAASDRCNVINDELNKMKTTKDAMMTKGQKCELFITMKRSKPNMEDIDWELKRLSGEESIIQRYRLIRSSQVDELMKNTTEICKLRPSPLLSMLNRYFGKNFA